MKRDQLLAAVKKVESEGLLPAGDGDRVGARLAELLIPPRDHARSAAAVIAWLGGVLIAAGILSFVAANWDTLGKAPKLVLVFGTLAGLHWAGFHFGEQPGRRPGLGRALTGAGMLAFGGAIGLVAQIYHLSSHYPNAVLVWWVLTLPFVLLIRSRLLLLIPLSLFMIWAHVHAGVWIEDHQRAGGFWWSDAEVLAFGFFELGLGALLAAVAALCRGSRHDLFAGPIAVIGRLAAFAGLFILSFDEFSSSTRLAPEAGGLLASERLHQIGSLLTPFAALGGAALLLGIALLLSSPRAAREGRRHELLDGAGALAAAAVVALALLLLPEAAFLVANAAVLGAVIGLVMRGVRAQRPVDVNLAVVAFLVTTMARYFEFVAKGFEPFFAFLGAGILLLALGGFLERKRRGWVARAIGSTP